MLCGRPSDQSEREPRFNISEVRGGRKREAKPAKGINWKAEREKGNCRGRESATRIGCDEVDDACNRETERGEETGRERKTGGCLSYVKDKEKSRRNTGLRRKKKVVLVVLGWKLRRQGTIATETPHGRNQDITFPLMLFTEFAPPADHELKW